MGKATPLKLKKGTSKGYLEELLTGDYASYNEDRLSQIFSASFNSSENFKRYFLKVIGINPSLSSDYSSHTQKYYGSSTADARVDILIHNKRGPSIFIENKVDAPLKISQLKKYDKIKELNRCKKFAIVKHYFESFSGSTNWKIIHWTDVHQYFKKEFEKRKLNPVDHYIIGNFIKHLELMNMERVNKISKKDLLDFANALNKIRTQEKPYIALSNKGIFETGTQILSFLEEVIDMAHQESVLMKRAGKNFRFNPHIEWWYEEEETDMKNLSITTEIKLNKSTNHIGRIGTGFYFYNNKPKLYNIITFAYPKGSWEFEEETISTKKEVEFDDYAKQVINSWKKWVQKPKKR